MRASKRLLPVLAIAALAIVAWLVHGDDRAAPMPAAVPRAASMARAPQPPARMPAASALPAPAQRQQLAQNLQLVEHTYCSYRAGTKYPATSRPIGEHPDQVYPNAPVTEANPMRLDGGGVDPKVLVQ
ncbi:MAG: hypothetical protein ABWY27_06010, partial [Telluria sp.]